MRSKTRRHPAILFDLDGTLIDPVQGITQSYKAMLNDVGLPIPSETRLRSFIGPPLRACVRVLLPAGQEHRIEELVARYRYYYAEQQFMLLDPLYDGIAETLLQLRQAGYRLFVATSKAQAYAREILRHVRVERYFVRIYGSELNGDRSEKTHLIAHILKQEGISPPHAVMVGDRKHDVLGAKFHGLPCIGVTYGYGSAKELRAAGAVALCRTPGEIPSAIARLP